MADTINLPQIGAVKKTYFFGAIGLVAGILVYAYWKAGRDGVAEEDAAADSEFGDSEVLPVVPGGVGGPNFGLSGTATEPAEPDETRPTTNAAWTTLAKERLAGSYDLDAIDDALGRYLGRQPLSALDQRIVQAAIANAGYPPVGDYTVIPGGDVDLFIAPKNLRSWPEGTLTTTQIPIQWDEVSGALGYRIYRSDLGNEPIGDSADTKFRAKGLQPGTEYTFLVAARDAKGAPGPKSTPLKLKTKSVTLKAPTGLKVAKIQKDRAYLTWNAVAGADGYRMYHDKAASNVGASGDGQAWVYGLKPNTTYRFHVRALDDHGNIGPASSSVSKKTPKK